MDNQTKQELMTYLSRYITQNKLDRIEEVLQNRTRYIAVVTDDLYHTHNASAVIRSCECFGIQDLYAIENTNIFQMHKAITSGAGKWIDILRFPEKGEENIKMCVRELRRKKYRIAVTTLEENSVTPDEISLDEPVALVFGNEEVGVNQLLLKEADIHVKIPMYGFTQSFNISVSAALLVSPLIERLHKSGIEWQLSEQEIFDLRLDWIRRVEGSNSRKMELLEKHFFEHR